jgi:riboflavin synthase
VFTGIVEAVGRVVSRERGCEGVRIEVDAGALDLHDVAIGDSVAVSGCCLTVVQLAAPGLRFDVSEETLACTTGFALQDRVNLERALRFSDRLGGHLMSGHVDCVGEVVAYEAAGEDQPGHRRLDVRVPAPVARYIAAKGSVAVDGVSLTVAGLEDGTFSDALIPHTLHATTLGAKAAGDVVNLEVDILAKYVESLLNGVKGGDG